MMGTRIIVSVKAKTGVMLEAKIRVRMRVKTGVDKEQD
jgi:hypothetical protein